MSAKFNFLDHYSGLDKIIAEVERKYPHASNEFIRRQARAIQIERKASQELAARKGHRHVQA